MSASGQGVTTSAISGTVTDANGEPLPGANVVAIHQPSGTRYGASTGENGRYTLANLRVGGPYQVTASFVGYQSKRREGFSLALDQPRTVNFTLQEKTAELDEVQVVAERDDVFNTRTSGIATNISSASIESTPTLGRKIADITRQVPSSFVRNSDDDGAAVSFAGQPTDYNAFFIDGVISNDVFGLTAQGTDGGQSGATPISLSAIEEFQVNISPFDVRQSGFTGAAVNAVTKSGSNEWSGEFEYYRRANDLGSVALAQDLPGGSAYPEFSNDRFVGNLGGPIIKDELFFFVNADILRSSEPAPFTAQGGFDGSLPAGPNATTNQNLEIESVPDIRPFLQNALAGVEPFGEDGYNPGTYTGVETTLDREEVLAKLDWNIAQGHTLTARYLYNHADNTDAFQSGSNAINFSSSFEVFPHTAHNATIQYKGSLGDNVSNQTSVSYKNVYDDRGINSEPFPTVDIDNNGGTISLGSEPFSYANELEQDVYTFTSDFQFFLGDHTVTVGTHNEYYDIRNQFLLFNQGNYDFDSIEQFERHVLFAAGKGPKPQPVDEGGVGNPFMLRAYSLVDDDPSTDAFEEVVGDESNAAASFQAMKTSLYAQDEWQVNDRLSLTYGLRLDVPAILDDPPAAPDANTCTLVDSFQSASCTGTEDLLAPLGSAHDLKGAQAGEAPDPQFNLSPRIGFNLDVFGDQETKLRGGAAVLNGRIPYVWPGSQYQNNGVTSGFFASPTTFEPNVNEQPNFGSSVPNGALHVFSEDFSYPRVLRTSLGLDQQLPGGFVGTLEGQYTNSLENVQVENVNLRPPNETLDGIGDNRPIWAYGENGGIDTGASFLDQRYDNVLLVSNTDRGYSYNVTAELQKQPFEIADGSVVRGRVAYTYGDSYTVNDRNEDTLGSLWDSAENVNGTNSPGLSRSDFSLGHRIQFNLSYRQEIGENFALTSSVYYTGLSGRPFTYTIANAEDLTGTASGDNTMFYVPQSVSQLNLSPITDRDGNVLRSVSQQRRDLQRFIDNVDYLDQSRGGYTDRNGDRTPWEGVVDLKFSLEVFGDLVGQQQKLIVDANIFNFSSLLGEVFNTDWGTRYGLNNRVAPVRFEGFQDAENGNYTPVYQSNLGTDNPDRNLKDTFDSRTTGSTYSSLYQVQLGIRYQF